MQWTAGAAYFTPEDPWRRRIKRHLWVVISDPIIDDTQVLSVNFTSSLTSDPACIVEPEEYVKLDRRSYVAYSHARVATAQQLTELVNLGQLEITHSVSAELLGRMRRGAVESDFLEPRYLKILQDQGLV